MNTSMPLQQAVSVLTSKRVEKLAIILARAVEAWGKHDSAVLDETARARIIYNYVHWNANQEFGGDRGFSAGSYQQQKYFSFDDELIVRVKRVDKKLATRSYPTAQALKWKAQQALPTMPAIARLNLGYRLDPTGTAIQDAFLLMPNGDPITINDWIWQILGEKIDTYGIQLRFLGALDDVYRYDDFSSAANA